MSTPSPWPTPTRWSLRANVGLEMPPTPTWFTGREAVVGFLAERVLRKDLWRLVWTVTPTAQSEPQQAWRWDRLLSHCSSCCEG
ncbi:hypothetical protein [Streptomyces sp. MN13]